MVPVSNSPYALKFIMVIMFDSFGHSDCWDLLYICLWELNWDLVHSTTNYWRIFKLGKRFYNKGKILAWRWVPYVVKLISTIAWFLLVYILAWPSLAWNSKFFFLFSPAHKDKIISNITLCACLSFEIKVFCLNFYCSMHSLLFKNTLLWWLYTLYYGWYWLDY